jgi:hypothetical protein
VAAYGSYTHQFAFAVKGGADVDVARWWPLSVDGLLLLASLGLLRGGAATRRARWSLWGAFTAGVVVSLVANIAAAPTLTWASVLVAGWPPVALLCAVELLAHRSRRASGGAGQPAGAGGGAVASTAAPSGPPAGELPVGPVPVAGAETGRDGPLAARVAEIVSDRERAMWHVYVDTWEQGRPATGADLDRATKSNNYGRKMLRRWARLGWLDETGAPVGGPARLVSAGQAAG